jgi:hypothetical protein
MKRKEEEKSKKREKLPDFVLLKGASKRNSRLQLFAGCLRRSRADCIVSKLAQIQAVLQRICFRVVLSRLVDH